MSNSLSVKHLETLVKIHECGGISEAARMLNISPSAVSKNLANLESQLGVTLIKRTTRSLKLTEAGEYLVKRAQTILFDIENVFNTTTGYYDHPHGEIKITSSVAFGYAHLVSISDRFRKKNPEVEFNIDLNDHFVNLHDQNFDVALRIASSPPQNLALRKLCSINWSYCATPSYLSEYGTPDSTSMLTRHKRLVYPGLTPQMPFLSNSEKLNTPLQANSSLILLKAVLQHQGIAYLPTYLIGDHIKSGAISPIVMDGKLTYSTHNLYALYFPSKYSNPKVRSFIDFMIDDVNPMPSWDEWITQ